MIAALDANRRLAELLGWTNIFYVHHALLGTPPAGEYACRNQAKVPDWTGDWRDCGPLMVEHVQALGAGGPWVAVGTVAGFDLSWCREEGECDNAAMRRSIVNTVIMKLLGRRK